MVFSDTFVAVVNVEVEESMEFKPPRLGPRW